MGVASHEQFDVGSSLQNISSSLEIKMRLFKNNFTPTRASVLADFTEADFSGYLAVNVNESDASNGALNRHEKITQNITFTHDGGATNNTIYGWYLEGNSSVNVNGVQTRDVIAYEKFATPITMDVNGDRIDVQIEALIEMLP